MCCSSENPAKPSCCAKPPSPTVPTQPTTCCAPRPSQPTPTSSNSSADKHSHEIDCCSGQNTTAQNEYGIICEQPKSDQENQDNIIVSIDPNDRPATTLGRHRVTFSVVGMDCPSCAPRVVIALNSMPSVAECNVDVFAGRATATYHPDNVLVGDMAKRVTAETGFKCQVLEDDPVGESEDPRKLMKILLARSAGEKYPEIDGVKVVREKSGLIEVEYDPELNPRDVLALFNPWGPTYIPPSPETSLDAAQRAVLRLLRLTTVSIVLCLPVLVLAWAPLPPNPNLYGGLSLGLTTIIQFYVARSIYVSGIRALLFQRTIDMDLLVAISTGTAYVFSTVAYSLRVAGRPIEEQVETYFETAALLVTLVVLGRLVAAYARRRSTNAAAQLSSMQAGEAALVNPLTNSTSITPAGLVHIGDVLRIAPGERVPTDGRVVQGEAYVDESSITGESAPALKQTGSLLVAGTVLTQPKSNLANREVGLDMKVTLTPDTNTISRMIELMRAAQGSRLKVQDTADRVAGLLAPIVLVLGIVTFCAWTGVGVSAAKRIAEGSRSMAVRGAVINAIGYAVAVLVVSCPCAIALCVPMVAVIAVAVGTKRGVLFKTVEALENAHKVQVVVFDKTGTLTLGKLSVNSSAYFPQDKRLWLSTEEGIQRVVRALTDSSTHPVSAAVHEHIVAALASISTSSDAVHIPIKSGRLDVRVVPGKGVEATVDGIVIRGGSAVWAASGPVQDLGDHTVFVVSVALDPARSEFTRIAHYTLSDELRPDALSTVNMLTGRGLEVHILSGDTPEAVTRTASALGIPPSRIRGGCSPEDKGQWVKFLQTGGQDVDDCEIGCSSSNPRPRSSFKRRSVMFVGDGTNDALALVQSDVGVSLGAGTDVASSAAQVVLLSSLHTGLSDVFALARASSLRIWINFAWAGIYNLLALLLASGALRKVRIPPQFAGLGELVSVLPVVAVAWSLGLVKW